MAENAAQWRALRIGEDEVWRLDPDAPAVNRAAFADMDAGVDVYYDRDWEVADALCLHLQAHPELLRGKRVLVIGAGLGPEAVVAGRRCGRVLINDHAPAALELAATQLRRNGVEDFELRPGSYTELDLDDVDLMLASFIVYSKPTAKALRTLLEGPGPPLILVNEDMPMFMRLLARPPCPFETLFEIEGARGLRFAARSAVVE